MDHGPISADLARRILLLRDRIGAAGIPSSKLDESLNIAIWNVRDFGKKVRSDDALHMIAEIIYQFDLVAFVELGEDLTQLQPILNLLGPRNWDIVFNDATPGYAGNRERIGFLFDQRMVTFNGFAAEVSPKTIRPRGENADGDRFDYGEEFTFWRAPYMASFKAGSFDFVMVAAHIRWDSDHPERRVEELEYFASWLNKRRQKQTVVDPDFIVVGDFNTPTMEADDAFFAALKAHDLVVPPSLQDAGHSNLKGGKRYDHILHYPRQAKTFSERGGILRFADPENYRELLPDVASVDDFTYQLSDHFPVWAQINTDLDDERLEQIIQDAGR